MSDLVTVESADGTKLVAEVSGSGPPMVLVHGTTNDRGAWMFVQPLLAEHHQLWAYDRRGRGDSGDGPDYSFEREVDDVRALLAATGDDHPHLFGYSFGAICALETARLEPGLASLTIYEPPLHGNRVAEAVRRTVELLHAGRPEEAALVFLPEVAGLSGDELAMARSMPPVWDRIVEVATATFERESKAIDSLVWDPDRYRSIQTPTLHITGELTEVPVYLAHDELVDAMPQAQHVVIAGQRHLALVGDPGTVADAVVQFARGITQR